MAQEALEQSWGTRDMLHYLNVLSERMWPGATPPLEFRREWKRLIIELGDRGKINTKTPQQPYQPILLLALAIAPARGFYAKELSLITGVGQPAISRTMHRWSVEYGLVEVEREIEPERDLKRPRRNYFRLTRRGRELAALLEAS